MIVLSSSKMLENSVQHPAQDLIGTSRIIVLSPFKILQSPVQDPV